MTKKYIVRLTDEESGQLTELVNKGKAAAYKIKHANVLLKVDANGPNWNDEQAAEAFSCAPRPPLSARSERGHRGAAVGWRERSLPDPARM